MPRLYAHTKSKFLFGTGDVLAQQVVERKGIDKHNFAQTARFTFWGGCFFGPVASQWYRVLERVKIPDSPNKQLLARVAADQFIFTPVNLLCFFTGMTYLEGGDPKKKIEKGYKPTLLTNWMVWPGVQLANFKFVPLEHRLLVVNLVSLGEYRACSFFSFPLKSGKFVFFFFFFEMAIKWRSKLKK